MCNDSMSRKANKSSLCRKHFYSSCCFGSYIIFAVEYSFLEAILDPARVNTCRLERKQKGDNPILVSCNDESTYFWRKHVREDFLALLS